MEQGVKPESTKLSLHKLIALVVGSMLGSGIFALPQGIATTTGTGAALIGWAITFVGMLSFVFVFKNLSLYKPELDAGIYSYAKEGFGDYMGFNSAWGYWISAWLGNIAYFILFCSSLSYFFPIFGDGTNIISLIFNSIMLWLLILFCVKGIKTSTTFVFITTIIKIVSIAAVLLFFICGFSKRLFVQDFWGNAGSENILVQIKKMMLVTVWVFIGIEGACIFSARAKNRQDVGKATMIGFLIVFFVILGTSILPFGILDQQQLSGLKNPSIAYVLKRVVGNWGVGFVSISLIIALLGSVLTWTLLMGEVAYVAATRDNLFPEVFAKGDQVNTGALYITGLCEQVYLVVACIYHSGYIATLLLATSMVLIPYFFSTVYALLLSIKRRNNNKEDLIISSIAVIYCIWLIYAAGIKYLFLSSILYSLGIPVYLIAKKQKNLLKFNCANFIIGMSIILIAIAAIISEYS